VFGTATYISPEAATGGETDQRSDIYSLGVLTYQLLSGELPFVGKTAGAVLMQHVHQEPPLVQTKGRGESVPEEVCGVVMRALSKDPDARQQSLAEFLDSLAEAAANAGLLNDARALLFGTIWGDDLAAPGSYLSDLLGASAPPSSASPLAATQPVPVARDPDDDALLSAAPKPFGTTSHDLAAVPERKKRKYGWLWAALALLALVFTGVVAGNWWTHREPRAVAAEPAVEPVPTAVAETPEVDAAVADVGTDVLLDETPVLEEVEPEPPVVEEEQVEEAPPVPAPKPKAKPKAKKKRPKKKRPPPALPPAPAPAPSPVLEPDDGIDWTVPDFPSAPEAAGPAAPAPEPDPSPPATASEPSAPLEPPPPTGTPDAPARNPVVIDEPPSP
jgi:serine/threonine-protein kinase